MKQLLQKREEAYVFAILAIALSLAFLIVHWTTGNMVAYAGSIPLGIFGGMELGRYRRLKRELKLREAYEQDLDDALTALERRKYQ